MLPDPNRRCPVPRLGTGKNRGPQILVSCDIPPWSSSPARGKRKRSSSPSPPPHATRSPSSSPPPRATRPGSHPGDRPASGAHLKIRILDDFSKVVVRPSMFPKEAPPVAPRSEKPRKRCASRATDASPPPSAAAPAHAMSACCSSSSSSPCSSSSSSSSPWSVTVFDQRVAGLHRDMGKLVGILAKVKGIVCPDDPPATEEVFTHVVQMLFTNSHLLSLVQILIVDQVQRDRRGPGPAGGADPRCGGRAVGDLGHVAGYPKKK